MRVPFAAYNYSGGLVTTPAEQNAMRFALLGSHPDGRTAPPPSSSPADTPSPPAPGRSRPSRAIASGPTSAASPISKRFWPTEPLRRSSSPAPPPTALPLRRACSRSGTSSASTPGQSPDAAYEAALVRGDTGMILLPLLPDVIHPGIDRARN